MTKDVSWRLQHIGDARLELRETEAMPDVRRHDPYRRSELPATSYDISPDGERFLMLKTQGSGAPQEIVVVLNWFAELERLVPTKD